MNTPDHIDRSNEALLAGALDWRNAGHYVLLTFDGLHAATAGRYGSLEEVNDALTVAKAEAAQSPSTWFKMLYPAVDGSPALDIAIDRPGAQVPQAQEASQDAPGGPQLTSEEDGELQVAVAQRYRCQNALLVAAMDFTAAQAKCDDLAVRLRKRLEDEMLALAPPADTEGGTPD